MKLKFSTSGTKAFPELDVAGTCSIEKILAGDSETTSIVVVSGISVEKSTYGSESLAAINIEHPIGYNKAVVDYSGNMVRTSENSFNVLSGDAADVTIETWKVAGRKRRFVLSASYNQTSSADFEVSSYGSTWIAEHNNWIESILPANRQCIFTDDSGYNHWTDLGGRTTRNTSGWFDLFRNSLTAISTRLNTAVTAVTPRHGFGAAHYALPVGSTVRFRAADNSLVERTIISALQSVISTSEGYLGSDRVIYTFDSDLPASIHPMKVLGAYYTEVPDLLASISFSEDFAFFNGGCGPYVIWLDTTAKACVGILTNEKSRGTVNPPTVIGGVNFGAEFWAATIVAHPDDLIENPYRKITALHGPKFLANVLYPYGGCSANPVMLPYPDGTLALVQVWGSPTNGSQFIDPDILNAAIAYSDDYNGISTGYTVTVAPDPTA